MIGRKTAALIAASIEAGALLATDDDEVIARYRGFGWALGLAFQLNDDLLGIWGAEQATGKEPSDVAHRKKTLPVIYAHETAGPEDRDRLAALYAQPDPTPGEVAEIIAILERTGAREYTRDEARRYRDEALAELDAAGVVRPAPASASSRSSWRSSAPDGPSHRAGPSRSRPSGPPRRCRSSSRLADDEDLADPPAVGRLDGQRQAVDRDLVAGLRDAADAVVDEPADRVVLVLVLEPERRCRTARARSSTSARPSTRASSSESRTIIGSSSSYSSWISPTISSSRSSIVTRPAVPPYSSSTIAMWTLRRWNSWSRSSTLIDSGTKTGVRRIDRSDGRSLDRPLQERQQVLRVEDADDLVDRSPRRPGSGCGPPR